MKNVNKLGSIALIGLLRPEVAQASGDPGLLISFAIVAIVQISCLINLIAFRGTRRARFIAPLIFLIGGGWLVNLNLSASPYYFGEVLLAGMVVLYTYIAKRIAGHRGNDGSDR